MLYDKTIYLIGERYQRLGGIPRLFFEEFSIEMDGVQRKYIYIVDVLMVDDEIGNGTIAMNALIKYAKKINAEWINGSFSAVDDDHADRRNHYYEKFGFVINGSDI